jgi:asparagine synthase (glutamine-hydrolysing)
MSAIFGIFRHDSHPVSRDHLELMATTVKQRGPDGMALFVEGAVGLGFARFLTGRVPEPIPINDSQDLVVVADARIDNREELLKQLGLPPDSPDSQIIRTAHRQWGSQAPGHLLGPFGYAAWDRSESKLTIARDHLGVRPIYLCQTGSFTAFATDSRSILALPEVSKEIDEVGICQFFFGQLPMLDKETTCYSAIKRLPSAHVLEILPSGEETRVEYWAPDPEREVHYSTDDDYTEAFRERFTRAVARCIPPEGDVGSTLSGGLDSSSIAMVAAQILEKRGQGPLHTFSGIFPSTPEADESEFIRAVADQHPIISHEYEPGEQSPLETVAPFMHSMAQPFTAPNLFLPIGACRLARASGLRVLLDGTDGDTTVGHGFDLFLELARAHRWSTFAQELEDFSRRFGDNYGPLHVVYTSNYALPELFNLAAQGRWLKVAWGVNCLGKAFRLSRKKLLKSVWRNRKERQFRIPDFGHLPPEFAAKAEIRERLNDVVTSLSRFPATRRALHLRTLTSGALSLSLETLDSIAAASGIQYGFPFCDRELVEFCLAIPTRQQMRDGWSRWIMRKAMSGVLPSQVCWRGGKANMSPVFQNGLIMHAQQALGSMGRHFPQDLEPYFEEKAFQRALDRVQNGTGLANDFQILWQAAILNSWLIYHKKKYFSLTKP